MKGLIVFILTAVLLVSFASAAYDMTQGPDWKWAYAQTYVNESLSKLHVNAADIEFAKMKVAAAEEDCINIGGEDPTSQWCKWAQEDNQTLARMLNAQANPVAASSSSNIFQAMWESIKNFFGL